MPKETLNVFQGPAAVRDFLNPENNPMIPLVEIPDELNPLRKDGVRIFAKMMSLLPLMNVKSLPALNMLLEAEKQGELEGVKALIENSSGNTVFSLAAIARLFGIQRTKAIVSHEVMWGKLQLLRLFGTEISVNEEPICPDPNDKTSGIYKAKKQGVKKGWLNPGQYDNEANPQAHEQWTAPQIWEQTEGKLTVFSSGVGTAGTLLGCGRFFKRKSKSIFTIGVTRFPNNPVPGVRTENLLQGSAFDWQSVTDEIEQVGTKESFEASVKLCRAGLMAGPSSGFALAGLMQSLLKKKGSGELDALRNKDGEVVAVFVAPDSPLPYLNDYFEFLGDSYFPKIENEELLINKPNERKKKVRISDEKSIPEVSSAEAYSLIYDAPQITLWDLVNHGKKIPMRSDVLVLDIRSKAEFLHFHLPGAIHKYTNQINDFNATDLKKLKKKRVFLICQFGQRTKAYAKFMRERGIEAFNIEGGATEWSRLNLPRWRAEVCRPLLTK